MKVVEVGNPTLTVPADYANTHPRSFNSGVRAELRKGMEQRYGTPYEWVHPGFDLAEPWVLRPVTPDETAP